jgi:hypothetical protein
MIFFHIAASLFANASNAPILLALPSGKAGLARTWKTFLTYFEVLYSGSVLLKIASGASGHSPRIASMSAASKNRKNRIPLSICKANWIAAVAGILDGIHQPRCLIQLKLVEVTHQFGSFKKLVFEALTSSVVTFMEPWSLSSSLGGTACTRKTTPAGIFHPIAFTRSRNMSSIMIIKLSPVGIFCLFGFLTRTWRLVLFRPECH